MSAREILRMIETVDPSDSAKLDEIDAHVWCYIHECELLEYEDRAFYCNPTTNLPFWKGVIPYSRCRTNLKSIRPEGWWFAINCEPGMEDPVNGYRLSIVDTTKPGYWECWAHKFQSGGNIHPYVESKEHPTEELAELHAILQAVEFDRKK